jgi:hypothetical protein
LTTSRTCRESAPSFALDGSVSRCAASLLNSSTSGRKVAQLRREIADLRARLESLDPTQGGDQAASPTAGS